MHPAAIFGCLLMIGFSFVETASSQEATVEKQSFKHSTELSEWIEASGPPLSRLMGNEKWEAIANHSPFAWSVGIENGKPVAKPFSQQESERERASKIPFSAKADLFYGAHAVQGVESGWIVGFNGGEFSAGLYWISPDGQQNYRISDHQIVELFRLNGRNLGIEGLSHLTTSRGSLIEIFRPATVQWQVRTLLTLPSAPITVALVPDGSMLIVLRDSIAKVTLDLKMEHIVRNLPWDRLYPNSSVLSPDGNTLYVGMRKYVAKYDIQSRRLKYLIPKPANANSASPK